ncbi:DUF6973 domain-containing protein [Rasiella sp. SM2506]|uniref:DUF6973 domain-containing protein n=1 Tax=Rasiella sp. SM2506 TaxID=3423914 RepID=UPI003D7A892A
MKIWARIKKLSFPQLWQFSVLFLKHPLLIIPTLQATKRTFQICDTLYGKEHHKSNKANAFRHALWNVLLCKNSMKRFKNKQKSVFWAQNITDLYEKVTQNEVLEEAMDLHNNTIGRICFLNFLDQNEEEIVTFLQNKAENSQKVEKLNAFKKHQNQLVYLLE